MAGLARDRGALRLLVANERGSLSLLTLVRDQAGELTVHLAGYGGESGREINTFVFGNAPAGADRVDVVSPGAIGSVQSGLFIVGLPTKTINPTKLRWRFLASDGALIVEGSDIRE